jgi:hypothetical protein
LEGTATAVARDQPTAGGIMPGKITRIAVTYTVDTPGGPQHTFHCLLHMRQHIRPDRLQELLDDLTVVCEDLLASRQPTSANGLSGLPRRAKPQS